MIYNKNKELDMENGIKNLGVLTYTTDDKPRLIYYCNFCRDEMLWNVSQQSELVKECDLFIRDHIQNFHVEILVALSFMKNSPSDSWTLVFNQDSETAKVTTGEIAVTPLGGGERWSYTDFPTTSLKR